MIKQIVGLVCTVGALLIAGCLSGSNPVNSNQTAYSVTYNGNSNTSGSVPTDANAYEQGASVTVKANTGNLVRTSFSFAGWNTAANGSGTDYAGSAILTMGSTAVTLYAKWTQNPTSGCDTCGTGSYITFASGNVIVKTNGSKAYVIDKSNTTLTRIDMPGSGTRLAAIGSNQSSESDFEVVYPAAGIARRIRSSQVDYQVSIGSNSNPEDIAFADNQKAYISQLKSAELLVINMASGAITGRVNLARFNPAGKTVPSASPLMVVGTKLYVACQRLDQDDPYWPAVAPGMIAVISTVTDSIVDSIELDGYNPYAIDTVGSLMYVSIAGDYFTPAKQGLEIVDLSGDSTRGFLCDGTVIGSSPTAMKSLSSSIYTLIYDATYKPMIKVINRTAGTLAATITINAGGGFARDGNSLFVGDRNQAMPGIATINTTANTVDSIRIPMTLPPYSLAVLK